MDQTFLGYRRSNGNIGIRNHVVVIPTSIEANHVASRIQRLVPGAIALPHEHGVVQTEMDIRRTFRILCGVGANPNVFAVLVIGVHESDAVPASALAHAIAATGQPVEVLLISQVGGTLKAIQSGVAIASKWVQEAEQVSREPVGVEALLVGSKCGGSDATSGLACNPALGSAMDRLVRAGGRVVFSETTEIIGAEHILAGQTVSREVADKLLACVARFEDAVNQSGADMRGGNPSPGNIAGGLSTIEEKSLGCISKAGTTPLCGVVEYGEPIVGRGLYFMDSPGNDIECVSGMIASGAHIVCFSTGRGTPTGSPVVPVIKLCANPLTSTKMADNIDVDASDVLSGRTSIDEMGLLIYEHILQVASGRVVRAEMYGHREFSINRIAMSR